MIDFRCRSWKIEKLNVRNSETDEDRTYQYFTYSWGILDYQVRYFSEQGVHDFGVHNWAMIP